MKKLLILLIFVINLSVVGAQTYTFSNATANAHDSWNSSNNWAHHYLKQ